MTSMQRADLAALLASTSGPARAALIERHGAIADAELAGALKALYLETYSSAPAQAAGAAAALENLAQTRTHAEIVALARWTSGLAALQLEARHERAIQLIDDAAAGFEQIGQAHTAAATQVSKIYALAMLGRYDEAIECGLRAREVFLASDDALSAGKVEQNLGNLYHRRDQYSEAERFYRAARDRFAALGDQTLLAYADNGLANVLSVQHHFHEAGQLYEQALLHAEAAGLEVTRAEIECNLGNLELFQGRYDQALGYLERSRRRYAELGMPHDSAASEQELADAYLALNLAPEAAQIYHRVTNTFAELGMRAEQARALLNHGYACLQLGRRDEARALLGDARVLFEAEGNRVGAAQVLLAEAQLAYNAGDYRAVAMKAEQAETPIAAAGAWGRLLLVRWLRGEAYRRLGFRDAAGQLFDATLRDALDHSVPQIAQRCYTALGFLAAARGNRDTAAHAFQQAIELIETMRAPLPTDEFRTAFIADKLTPFAEMLRLCLADPARDRTAEAFAYLERGRARAMFDLLDGAEQRTATPRDTADQALAARMAALRAELNWFYSQINRPNEGAAAQHAATMAGWQASVREREATLAQISRQLQQHAAEGHTPTPAIDLAQLRRTLGHDTALIEYFELDQQLAAFVVTDEQIVVARNLGSMGAIAAAIEQFRFQIGALRYGSVRLQSHLAQLNQRAQHHLAQLYDLLIRPIEARLGTRRLAIVPHRTLHYVPFQALYDGEAYVVDRREVCYAPSAQILQHCATRPSRPLKHAVIVGVQDARTPHVHNEIEAVAARFGDTTTLLDEQANVAALQAATAGADVLHIACHGHFRPDNPLFSALELHAEQLTVRDTYQLDLRCQLVTLSACETGVNDIAPGDELLGLARGFMSAGAPALLLSL